MWRWGFFVALPAGFLLVIILLSCRTYIRVMYDNQLTYDSAVESANFAVQTVTTVGYGNWETPIHPLDFADRSERLLQMRFWSVVYMLFGATF